MWSEWETKTRKWDSKHEKYQSWKYRLMLCHWAQKSIMRYYKPQIHLISFMILIFTGENNGNMSQVGNEAKWPSQFDAPILTKPEKHRKIDSGWVPNRYSRLKNNSPEPLFPYKRFEPEPMKNSQNLHFYLLFRCSFTTNFNSHASLEQTKKERKQLISTDQEDEQNKCVLFNELCAWGAVQKVSKYLIHSFSTSQRVGWPPRLIDLQWRCSPVALLGCIMISTNYWMGVPRVWRFALSVSLEWLWLAVLENLEITHENWWFSGLRGSVWRMLQFSFSIF
jgi:hypothetical protein